tara:strand:+ start:266 stop:913 length:648 start_codon:yes stop_codon:yes gene_type:complete
MKIFIPIKHSSQRVPKKNFRNFNGEPLYKHSLLKYSEFEVYVDTDSEQIIYEINNDSRFKNVTVYKRDNKLIGHEVSVCDLIKNFISKYDISRPLVQLHVTSPFLNPQIIKDAYSFMSDHDSVVSCNLHNSRFWRKEKYGFCPLNHNPLKLEQTQDLPTIYEENSAFYMFKPSVVLSTGNRIGQNPYFYSISRPHNMDIDTEQDWKDVLGEINEN